MKICGVNVLILVVQVFSIFSVDCFKLIRYFMEVVIYKIVGYKGDVLKECEVQNLISQYLFDWKCQFLFLLVN